MVQLNGKLNVFKDILEYMELTKNRNEEDHFFCTINYGTYNKNKFFKDVNLGEPTIGKYVTEACDALGIKGLGSKDHMTIHGLRATVITPLFETGQTATCIQLRSGHKSIETLKDYRNLRGSTGRAQQRNILADKPPAQSGQIGKRLDSDLDESEVRSGSEQQNAKRLKMAESSQPIRLDNVSVGSASQLSQLLGGFQNIQTLNGGVNLHVHLHIDKKQ